MTVQPQGPGTSSAAVPNAPHREAPVPVITPRPEDVTSLDQTRSRVRDMLTRSPAFLALPPDERRKLAHDTVNVLHFLGDQAPLQVAGAPAAAAMTAPSAYARAQAGDGFGGSGSQVSTGAAQGQVPVTGVTHTTTEPAEGQFRAGAAREGAAVAGALLQSVNFVEFVGGLIQNVYVAIVDASIKQIQAYGEMVASVAKSVDEFKRDNITANQGRDYLVDQFPDLFDISTEGDFFGEGRGEPRVVLREGVDDREAAERVSRELNLQGEQQPRGLDSDTLEKIIVPAAQMQLALSRQRLLATTLLMGLQKIVVTDGRISAKVMYNFRSKDVMSRRTRAVDFDYGDQVKTTRQGAWDRGDEGYQYDSSGSGEDRKTTLDRGKRWSKGHYHTTTEPVIEMQSVTTESTTGSLEATAALAGAVDINFKSETVDLNKIADTIQMNQIQGAAGMMQAAAPQGSPGIAATQPQQQPALPAPATTPAAG
ncbi:MAG: hypothetical protein JSU82_17340 [Rhodospirillales bacterium]|nr:MAG: hypothetical protein JSU82_17340 [Rhodospirillales bacterium]